MNPSMQEPRSWVEITPDIINDVSKRSARNYIAAVKQFEVETNPRYIRGHDNDPRTGQETYCNIFVWDVSKAMSCEIPHWVDPITGVEVPAGKGRELSANGICDWFTTHGLTFEWMHCGPKKAQDRASMGFPTVVLWRNPSGIGHMAMVLPGMDFIHIAQAGAHNFFDKDLVKGFGSVTPLHFYTHD